MDEVEQKVRILATFYESIFLHFYPVGYLLIWQPSNQRGALTPNLSIPHPL
jgi:hypothetical protein